MSLARLRFLTWTGLALIVALTFWCMQPIPTLWEAIENGDETHLRLYLTFGVNPNTRDAEGSTLLMQAASQGQLPVARLLVERGADVNAETPQDHSTALIKAKGIPMLRYLLEHGANPNARDTRDFTRLTDAALSTFPCFDIHPSIEEVRLLLDYGAKVDGFMLANTEDAAVIRLFLERGVAIETRIGKLDATILTYQSIADNTEIVQLLLDRGAKIDARDIEGRTPLMRAVCLSSNGMVRLLLRHGADVNAVDYRNKSALSLAIERGWSTRVALLSLPDSFRLVV